MDRSLDDVDVPNDFREYLGFPYEKDTGGPVLVFNNDTSATIREKIETVVNSGSPEPAGVGRIVQLPAGRLILEEDLLLSQGQSICGVKGSTILTLATTATITNRDLTGIGAFITIDKDDRGLNGIAGQGVLQDLDIDMKSVQIPVGFSALHGLYAPARGPSDEGVLHTMRNVAVYNAASDGIHFAGGNSKLVGERLRSEGSLGTGIFLAGGDIKLRAIGSVAKGSALKLNTAALELDQFDLWREPNPIVEEPTLDIIAAPNGCVIKSGTVEGRTRYTGKNESTDTPLGGAHYINSKAQFAFVHFKYDSGQTGVGDSCYFEARSADLVELISCKFGESGTAAITPYTYLIMITYEHDEAAAGFVKVSGAGGMLRYLGRNADGTKKMRIDAAKHICNRPDRLLFE